MVYVLLVEVIGSNHVCFTFYFLAYLILYDCPIVSSVTSDKGQEWFFLAIIYHPLEYLGVPHMSCIKCLNIKFINKSAFKRICNLNNMKKEQKV